MIAGSSGLAAASGATESKPSISDVLPQRGSTEAIERGMAAMARARELYSNLKSYQDHSIVRKIQNYSDREYTSLIESSFACERPSKFRVDFEKSPSYGELTMVSDGKRYLRSVNQSDVYTEGEAPDITARTVFKNDIVADNVPPHFYLVARGTSTPELLLRTPREVIDSREETLDGRKGLRVVCLAISEQETEKADAKADIVHEFWFDEQTGAIGEMVRDWTVRTRESDKERQPDLPSGAEPHIASQLATITRISNVRLNEPVTPEAFSFKPQPHWKKVPEFITQSGVDMGQYRTLGLAAPNFKLRDLKGNEVALADLKGRVVLLDFWATWCGPCVLAMPHLQKLQDEFKDQPVTILGLNSDYALSDEKLEAWMSKRNFTFGTLRLVDGSSTFQDFGVGGIPHTVLIGKDGIVQDVTVGFMGESHGEVLKDRISKLLAGESLKSQNEFKSLREGAAKTIEPNVGYVRGFAEAMPVDEVNAGRFSVSSKVLRNMWASKAGTIELPDGTMGVLCPVYNDGIKGFSIFNPTTGEMTNATFEGGGSEFLEWTAFRDGPIKIVGFPMKTDRQTFSQKFGDLVCWDLDGKKTLGN